jgi:hypothetical protein
VARGAEDVAQGVLLARKKGTWGRKFCPGDDRCLLKVGWRRGVVGRGEGAAPHIGGRGGGPAAAQERRSRAGGGSDASHGRVPAWTGEGRG